MSHAPLRPRRETPARAPAAGARGETLGAAAGMVVFALFVHRRDALVIPSLAGLGWTAWIVHRSFERQAPARLLALSLSRRAAWLCVAAALLGALLAAAYRRHAGAAPWPAELQWFAPLAALIGTVEELLYRGWFQSRLEAQGRALAVLGAAALHASYKCALFAPGLAPRSVDLVFLAVATVVVGAAFGALRAAGGSVIAPVCAHAAFDLIVYGDAAGAPWWVWS